MAFILRPLVIVRLGKNACKTKCRFFSVSTFRYGTVVPFKLTDIGEGIREVIVKEWYVKPGDKIAQFENVCEVQSDKASVTITSRYDGIVRALHYKIDDVVLVGNPLVDIEINDDREIGNREPEDAITQPEGRSDQNEPVVSFKSDPSIDDLVGKVLATPAVRRLALEYKIQLKDVTATGKDHRVLKEDILAHIQKISSPDSKVKSEGDEGNFKTVPMKGYRKQMWKSMTKSLNIPHFVYSDECDMTNLVNLKNEVQESFKERGLVLTYTPFFIKAASKVLQKMPELNAWIDEESEAIKVFENHNISVAMATAEGLVVPNIKNVQNLDIMAITKELRRLQDAGKKAAIPHSDLKGGTFCLSNIGMFGGTYMKPVILPPQIVIGAIGRAQKLPRFNKEGNVVPTYIVSVSWAADHRVLDGVIVSAFSNLWKHYIQNPSHLLLGL